MKIHESAENYLETILLLQRKNGSVRSVDIAREMDFSKASISRAMNRLRQSGHIEMDASGYITMTQEGLTLAQNVYERHRVISRFLMSLGVSEEAACEDACRIEHDISQETFECLKRHYEKETQG